jgi:hypothetical protein
VLNQACVGGVCIGVCARAARNDVQMWSRRTVVDAVSIDLTRQAGACGATELLPTCGPQGNEAVA